MGKANGSEVTSRKVEVFRPGTFTAMNGQSFAFTEADVAAMAASYDPAAAPAPVVVGHPKHDDPAFGWAEGFEVNAEGTLVASLGDLAPEFVSAVEKGRYRKVSMKFFPPDAPNNPSPGSYYPRHIGFLGGAAPAVSGLAPVQFAEGDEAELIEIEFVEPAMEDVASIFRSVREFIIEKFSREDADRAVPEYLIRWVDDAADAPAGDTPAFVQPKNSNTKKEPEMSGDAAALSAREAKVAEREQALVHSANLAFADGLVESGKLLPVQKDGAVALLDQLSVDADAEVAFSDDGTDKKVAPAQLLKDILSAQPEVVPSGRTEIGDTAAAPSFASPDGLAVDGDGLELHAKALAFQNTHPGTGYLAAVQAVQEG